MCLLFFMKMILLTLILTSSFIQAFEFYPEERDYTSEDQGLSPYISPSLYLRSEYVLTFDDGPHILHTPKLLDVLKKHQVKATFLMVTERLNDKTFPIFKRIIEEGHRIASHDHVHDNNNQVNEDKFKEKIEKSLRTLDFYAKKAKYKLQDYFYRFPFGAYGKHPLYHHLNSIRDLSYELFGSNCLQFTFWDIDSADWVPDMTSEDVFSTLKAHHEGGRAFRYKSSIMPNGQRSFTKVPYQLDTPIQGGVILQHDIQEKTIRATDLFLTYAKENNLKIIDLAQVDEYRVRGACSFLSN